MLPRRSVCSLIGVRACVQVWMLLMRLPTEEGLLGALETLQAVKTPQPDWGALLDSKNEFKLLYQLQIMESLVQPAVQEVAAEEEHKADRLK